MEIILILHFLCEQLFCTVYLMVDHVFTLCQVSVFPIYVDVFLHSLFGSISLFISLQTTHFVYYRFISLDSCGTLSLLLFFYSKFSQLFQLFIFPYEIANQHYNNAVGILTALKLQVNLERITTFMILNFLRKMIYFSFIGLLLYSLRYY